MFGNIKIKMKKFFERFRVFSRIRNLIDRNTELKDSLVNTRYEIKTLEIQLKKAVSDKDLLIQESEKVKVKHEKASKYVAKIKKSINEFLARIQANPNNLPDHIISGDMRTFKVWLMEPFMEEKWESYRPVNRREVFIDGPSAAKGFIKVADDALKEEAKDN